jgi:hypothetical protein
MSWHSMMEFEPPLVGCVISGRNHTFSLLQSSGECVINIPTVQLARQVVACGNCTGRRVDKFTAFGLTPAAAGDAAQTQRLVGLLMRRHDELAACIAAREPFDPILFELEDDDGRTLAGKDAIAALGPWAAGFMSALTAFPALLDEFGGQEGAASALIGILRHLPVDPEDTAAEGGLFARGRAELDEEVPLADLDEAIVELVAGVMEVADVTRPRRPIERRTAKVGRNDPCPCGSGRKFKHCHGRSVH